MKIKRLRGCLNADRRHAETPVKHLVVAGSRSGQHSCPGLLMESAMGSVPRSVGVTPQPLPLRAVTGPSGCWALRLPTDGVHSLALTGTAVNRALPRCIRPAFRGQPSPLAGPAIGLDTAGTPGRGNKGGRDPDTGQTELSQFTTTDKASAPAHLAVTRVPPAPRCPLCLGNTKHRRVSSLALFIPRAHQKGFANKRKPPSRRQGAFTFQRGAGRGFPRS